jgi:RimJ/RimL family protein N-acetyltransferase
MHGVRLVPLSEVHIDGLAISVDNEPSKRVAGQCGFLYEGTLRSHFLKPGVREDTEIWSRLPGDG